MTEPNHYRYCDSCGFEGNGQRGQAVPYRRCSYWDFNCRGEPGSLIVSYGNDGGEGYCGKWASVDITEHYA